VARVAAGAGVEFDPTARRDFRVIGDSPVLVFKAGEAGVNGVAGFENHEASAFAVFPRSLRCV